MKRPTFETIEKKRPEALLVIDKQASLLKSLLGILPKELPIVVVTAEKPVITQQQTVGFVPFKSTMPRIPDTYYSHIFVVYSGEKELLPLIPQFLQKARNDNAKIFFIMDLFFADTAFLQELVHSYRNAHALVLGDLFGEGVVPNTAKTIHRFFHQAKSSGTLTVRGTGLTQNFPVLISDAMREIKQAAFANTAAKIGYIFPKHAPSEISLARTLQSINPTISITFVSDTTHAAEGVENTQKMMNISASGTYLLQSNYPLLRKIKESNLLTNKHIPQQRPQEALTKTPIETPMPIRPRYHVPTPPKKMVRLSPRFFFIGVFLFLLPLLITSLFSLFGVFALLHAREATFTGDLRTATADAKWAHGAFSFAKTTHTVVSFQARFLGLGTLATASGNYLSLGTDGSFALSNVLDGANTYLAIFQKKEPDPQRAFLEASNKLKKAITIYEKVRAEQTLPGFWDIDEMVNLIGDTIDSYPSLLGFDGEKTYLLLFQNNMELRPTGGFIGSYGLLTVHNGSIGSFAIHDVYDADGQLTGHVEPVYPVRRFMGIVHQYLRDSNFDPDFPSAASVSANMLRLETGQAVDGVIAVDVSFVKGIVQAIQPINVPDYNAVVTADNFYLLTQEHVEKDFFPGSTQKKDFLRSLFVAMQLKLADTKTLPYVSLGKAVTNAIQQKHVLFAFPDASIQHLFSVNNLSASLLDTRSFAKNQYNDFLGISEANIGANKANAFVYRKVDQKVTLQTTGRFSSDVTIRYKNSSDTWPGGDYKNYVRIITPKGSILTAISIDGQKQLITPAITDYLLYERKDFIPPSGLEVETTEQQGKTLFGFLTIVPKGAFKTITVSYVSPSLLDMQAQLVSYDLWFFKQPGTDGYPYSFVFSYPQNYKPLRATKGLTVLGNSIVLEQVIATDQYFHVDLSKQQ